MNAPADVILTNGRVLTFDAACARAQAVAIKGEWIVAVGDSGIMERPGAVRRQG